MAIDLSNSHIEAASMSFPLESRWACISLVIYGMW